MIIITLNRNCQSTSWPQPTYAHAIKSAGNLPTYYVVVETLALVPSQLFRPFKTNFCLGDDLMVGSDIPFSSQVLPSLFMYVCEAHELE